MKKPIVPRLGALRVQVDRWPVTDEAGAPEVLSIIILGLYKSKPDLPTIIEAIKHAGVILESGS
jgi:hypothetical protein